MTGKDMEVGKYYYVCEENFWMIGKVLELTPSLYASTQSNHFSNAIVISAHDKFYINCAWFTYNREVREATYDEVLWLDQCIKQRAFVTKLDAFKYENFTNNFATY